MRKHRVTITLVISDDASANALILLLKALLKRLGRNYRIRCDGIRCEESTP